MGGDKRRNSPIMEPNCSKGKGTNKSGSPNGGNGGSRKGIPRGEASLEQTGDPRYARNYLPPKDRKQGLNYRRI